jgi:hypothetical protein
MDYTSVDKAAFLYREPVARISQHSTDKRRAQTSRPHPRAYDDQCYGLRSVVLQNRFLRVVVLPEAGGKIWQITYKPLVADLLWNNPKVAPARLPSDSTYDDVWSGGWDELFPNDEIAVINGQTYPDHGELWTGQWTAETLTDRDGVSVCLRYLTPLSVIAIEKTIRLQRDRAHIDFHHRFTNRARTAFPFLWKLHPAMAVSPQHRIDFPKMKIMLEPAFLGSLAEAEDACEWPVIRAPEGDIDLRRVAPEQARKLYFFYGTHMQAGWCAITNTATNLACGWQFDSKIFPCCWLFATYGGWRNYNVAVLEPATGYRFTFDAMKSAGRHRTEDQVVSRLRPFRRMG